MLSKCDNAIGKQFAGVIIDSESADKKGPTLEVGVIMLLSKLSENDVMLTS
jgi:hypothetical protein